MNPKIQHLFFTKYYLYQNLFCTHSSICKKTKYKILLFRHNNKSFIIAKAYLKTFYNLHYYDVRSALAHPALRAGPFVVATDIANSTGSSRIASMTASTDP